MSTKNVAQARWFAPWKVKGSATRLVTHSHEIRKSSFTVPGHRHVELRCESRRLLRLEGGRKHLPVAADGFIHDHGDWTIFVVTNLNLVGVLIDIARDHFVVGLFPL